MDQYSFFILLAPLGCAITIVTGIYCFRHQNTPAARPLGYTTLFAALYIITNVLELTNPTEAGTLFFAKLCYVCIGMITVNWMRFALAFSERVINPKSKLFFLFWIIPVCTIILVFSNSYQYLIWNSYEFIPVSHGFLYMKVTSYGAVFWIFWVQAYLLMVISAFLAIWASFIQRNRFRKQAIFVVVASLFPLAINGIYVLHLIPGLQKDYSPLAYALSAGLMTYSIFQYQLLDLLPFARSVLIDEMADVMLTLDKDKRVVDYNKAAIRLIHQNSSLRSISQLTKGLIYPNLEKLEKENSRDLIQSEVKIDLAEGSNYYDLQIRRLRNKIDSQVVGYLVLLHSITEHKNLLKEIQVMAEHDMLTGLYNRNYFEEAANQLILAGNNIFSVLMIDIDYFKTVNDSVGHRGGDQVLQSIAQKMQSCLRTNDIIGRFGGDEFVVLLPDTQAVIARLLADRLCASISSSPFKTDEGFKFSLSISVGISEFSKENRETLEQIIVQADQALYEAKSWGRNRTVIYNQNNSNPSLRMK